MSIHRIGAYRANWISVPTAAVAPAPAAPAYGADRYVVASAPALYWPATPPVPGPALSPAAVAQLQAMRTELALLETQLAALLALVAAPAVSPLPVPALPLPVVTPGVPAAQPVPAVPVPAPPPRPSVAQPAPALPAPPPVIPSAVPTPTPSAPAAQPAPPSLPFQGLVKGTRMMLAPGTSVMGFDVSGTAAVRESSPQVLDMVAKGSAMFGMVRRTYALRVEMVSASEVNISLHEIGRNGKPKKKVFAGNLAVLKSQPGVLTLKDPDGKPGSIRQAADGSLTIQHPQGTVKLLMRGVAPLVAGVDDVENDRPLA